jgi:putative transcriptional regulator
MTAPRFDIRQAIPADASQHFPVICSRQFVRRLKVASRIKPKVAPGDALGLKLLQSVREMKAGKAARVTHVELTEVAEARQASGLSQSQFAEALGISKRTLQEWEQG